MEGQSLFYLGTVLSSGSHDPGGLGVGWGEQRPGSQPPWPGAALGTLVSLARVFYLQGWTNDYYLKKLFR